MMLLFHFLTPVSSLPFFLDDPLNCVNVPLDYLPLINHLCHFLSRYPLSHSVFNQPLIPGVHKVLHLVQRDLLHFVLDGVGIELELVQEHVALDFAGDTLYSDFGELLERLH